MTNSILQATILGILCLIYAAKGAAPVVAWLLMKAL